jgi:hypothetical protein
VPAVGGQEDGAVLRYFFKLGIGNRPKKALCSGDEKDRHLHSTGGRYRGGVVVGVLIKGAINLKPCLSFLRAKSSPLRN